MGNCKLKLKLFVKKNKMKEVLQLFKQIPAFEEDDKTMPISWRNMS